MFPPPGCFLSALVPFYPTVKFGVGWEAVAHLRIGIGNPGWIEAEVFADIAAGFVAVLFGDGIVERELGFAPGRVDFDGDSNGGTQKDAVFALFDDEEISFFESEAPAEFGGDDEGSAFTDFGCVQGPADLP
jgi:hypothetical protein